jgi:hypothetical protein
VFAQALVRRTGTNASIEPEETLHRPVRPEAEEAHPRALLFAESATVPETTRQEENGAFRSLRQ